MRALLKSLAEYSSIVVTERTTKKIGHQTFSIKKPISLCVVSLKCLLRRCSRTFIRFHSSKYHHFFLNNKKKKNY